jgi:hypothetical protein
MGMNHLFMLLSVLPAIAGWVFVFRAHFVRENARRKKLHNRGLYIFTLGLAINVVLFIIYRMSPEMLHVKIF